MIRLALVAAAVLAAVWPGRAADAPLTRIAVGSCADQDKPLPIFDKIADLKPELLLLLGDNIYADLDKSKTVTADLIKEKYDTLAKVPGWQRLRAACPVLAVWDDHDYGLNDAGVEWPLKRESQKLLLDFFGEPADSPRRTQPGVYTSAIYGPPGQRVQVILLDARFNRSKLNKADRRLPGTSIVPYLPTVDPDATFLGAEQWKWLEGELRKPAELRLLATGIQVVADDHPFEKWANIPAERAKLFQLIRDTGATGVVCLSGDRHLGEISVEPGPAVGYPLYDLTSSGLNQGYKGWRPPEVNRYRVAAMPYGDNFGLVTVDWSQPDPVVGLQLRDVQGEIVARHSFPLGRLKAKADAPPAAAAKLPDGVISAQDALKKLGETVTVQFAVKAGRAVSGGKRVLLNSESDFRSPTNFTAVVNEKAMTGKLDKATFDTFKGKTIRVKGEVKKFRDQMQIEVDDEAQLEFVED